MSPDNTPPEFQLCFPLGVMQNKNHALGQSLLQLEYKFSSSGLWFYFQLIPHETDFILKMARNIWLVNCPQQQSAYSSISVDSGRKSLLS